MEARLRSIPEIAAACDDAMLSYIAGIAEEVEDASELGELVLPFLESAGIESPARLLPLLHSSSPELSPTAPEAKKEVKKGRRGRRERGGTGRRRRDDAIAAPTVAELTKPGASDDFAGKEEEEAVARLHAAAARAEESATLTPTALSEPIHVASALERSAEETLMASFVWNRKTTHRKHVNEEFELSPKELAKAQKRFERFEELEMRRLRKAREKFEDKVVEKVEGEGSGEKGGDALGMLMGLGDGDGEGPKGITCEGVRVEMGAEVLLESCDVRFGLGKRYGLIGRNGSGKTTLLRYLAQRKFEGIPKGMRILHVAQEIKPSEHPVLEAVLSADVERAALLKEEADLAAAGGSADRMADVASRLEAIDAHKAEARAATILHGLGFTKEMQSMPTKSLSGGWRMRVAIAGALFVEPDCLLLDEPTNHCDLNAVAFLGQYLQHYPKDRIVVVVSHDRAFLDEVCTDTVHLTNRTLTYYRGNYSNFELTRAERERTMARASEAREGRRKHIQSFVDRFRSNAKRATLVQSRLKTLARLEAVEAVANAEVGEDDPTWRFRFPRPTLISSAATGSSAPVVRISEVGFGFDPSRLLFQDVDLVFEEDTRLAILGANGSGKSTFLRILMGEIEPLTGFVWRHPKLKIAVFDQHHADRLDYGKSAVDNLLTAYPKTPDMEVRKHFGKFNVTGDLALRPVKSLSGGQKSRVSLAIMSFERPNLLILDEVTNHLDVQSIDALLIALGQYEGAVVTVSHDRFFVKQLLQDAGELHVLRHGKLSRYSGTVDDYAKEAAKETALPQHARPASSLPKRLTATKPTSSTPGAARGGGGTARRRIEEDDEDDEDYEF